MTETPAPVRMTDVQMKISVPTVEFAEAVLEAALGYTSYWTRDITWDTTTELATVLEELEDDKMGGVQAYMLTYDHIISMMAIVAAGQVCNWEYAKYAYRALSGRDSAEIDSPCADVILQIAIFGEVKYG